MIPEPRILPRHGLATFLLIAAFFLPPAFADDAAEAAVERSAAEEKAPTDSSVLLEYERQMIQGPDPGPTLTLFADGYLRVHIPRFLKRAGEYELHLSPHEIRDWLDRVSAFGLADWSPQRLHSDLRALPVDSRWTDPGAGWSVFRFPDSQGETQEIRFRGVSFAAAAHPGVAELRRLAKAQEFFESRLRDSRLTRVEGTP